MAIIYECERCGNQEKDKPEFLRGLKLKQVDYYGSEFQEWDKIYNICARCAKHIHSELERQPSVKNAN